MQKQTPKQKKFWNFSVKLKRTTFSKWSCQFLNFEHLFALMGSWVRIKTMYDQISFKTDHIWFRSCQFYGIFFLQNLILFKHARGCFFHVQVYWVPSLWRKSGHLWFNMKTLVRIEANLETKLETFIILQPQTKLLALEEHECIKTLSDNLLIKQKK